MNYLVLSQPANSGESIRPAARFRSFRSVRHAAWFSVAGMMVVGGSTPACAQARSIAEAPWTFTLAPYVWATSQDGDITIAGVKAKLDQDFEDIFQDLSLAGMLLFDVRKGPLVLSLNFVGARLTDDVTAHIDSTVDNINLGASVGYEVIDYAYREAEDGQHRGLLVHRQ